MKRKSKTSSNTPKSPLPDLDPPLEPDFVVKQVSVNMADTFKVIAESITKHLCSCGYQVKTPSSIQWYDIYRQHVRDAVKLAKEDLKDCPDFGEQPELIGDKYVATLIALSEFCERCAVRLRGKKADSQDHRSNGETPVRISVAVKNKKVVVGHSAIKQAVIAEDIADYRKKDRGPHLVLLSEVIAHFASNKQES